MNYEMFKEITKEKIPELLPNDFKNCKLVVGTFNRVNEVSEGMYLEDLASTGKIAPVIYLKELYDKYLHTRDLEGTLRKAANNLCRFLENSEISKGLNVNDPLNQIVFQLVNTEQNRGLLAGVPHREWNDLSIIYKYVSYVGDEDVYSAIIRNGLAERLGVSEKDLFELASENTKKLFPPVTKTMLDIVKESAIEDGMPKEEADKFFGGVSEEDQMYVVTNEKGINGAVAILYPEALGELAKKFGADLYILPSSVHECIVVSSKSYMPQELAEMVLEVNMNEVNLEERLSNNVYHYDKDSRKITLATNSQYKRLDGLSTEEKIHEQKEQIR